MGIYYKMVWLLPMTFPRRFSHDSQKTKKIIRAARGEIPADLVLKGGRVVNVFTCEIVETDVALAEGTIVGLGAYEGREVLIAGAGLSSPGLSTATFTWKAPCLPRPI